MVPVNPHVASLFSAIRTVLILLGGALATHDLANTGTYFWVEFGAATIMTLGPAAWGVWTAAAGIWRERAAADRAHDILASAVRATAQAPHMAEQIIASAKAAT